MTTLKLTEEEFLAWAKKIYPDTTEEQMDRLSQYWKETHGDTQEASGGTI
jgi:hypothetical protein